MSDLINNSEPSEAGINADIVLHDDTCEGHNCTTIVIAIADDDQDDHYFCQEALKEIKFKYCLATVYNGAQLLNLLLGRGEYSYTEDFLPDFIIMDINMPILDGLAALKAIKSDEKLKKIPVYILSNSNSEQMVSEARLLGANKYFRKPSELKGYKEIMTEILSGL